MPEVSEHITAALREACPDPPRALWPALISCADGQGVLPLLARAAEQSGWNTELRVQLHRHAAAEAAHALLRRRELQRVSAAFSDANVPVFLIKGAHLEEACYEAVGLRPRSDSDLFIREKDRSEVRRLLISAGYAPAPHIRGTVAFTQFHFVREDDHGLIHPLDVHWRISNAGAFASRLWWSDFWRRRSQAPGMAAGTFVPSLPLALLIACIHRVAHHQCSERMIWLYDIHTIAGRLGTDEFDDVTRLAIERGMLQVMRSGLQATIRHFATPLPESVLNRLSGAHDADVEVQRFLDGSLSTTEVLLSDWRQLRGFALRFAFLREHVFPDPDFIRSRYGISNSLALPFLYARRLAAGALRWL